MKRMVKNDFGGSGDMLQNYLNSGRAEADAAPRDGIVTPSTHGRRDV